MANPTDPINTGPIFPAPPIEAGDITSGAAVDGSTFQADGAGATEWVAPATAAQILAGADDLPKAGPAGLAGAINLGWPSIQVTNPQVDVTYTLAASDAGKIVRCTNANPITLTVPTNAAVPIPTNTVIGIEQGGAGLLTVAAAVGVTIRSLGGALAMQGQYAGAVLRKVAADEWYLQGAII